MNTRSHFYTVLAALACAAWLREVTPEESPAARDALRDQQILFL
ncbi:MAG: hypothetical protein QF437_14315 [Planctomycetota bacterium]|jgi:hypothetical protein|nr:hypothetical protein [Planctomycetota bacterium]MDP7131666.1 hypothetical protein [Planctomycetota bacterium]MDP7252308.1 hypothetical protein [Planctomycetota bacterium]